MPQDRKPPLEKIHNSTDEGLRRAALLPAPADQQKTAASAPKQHTRKRQTKMSRISEQRWNRLQREFRRAVWAEYPNPGRKDCPGTEALRDLAEHLLVREELQRDLRWKHALQCGPCYEEYIALKDSSAAGADKQLHQQLGNRGDGGHDSGMIPIPVPR